MATEFTELGEKVLNRDEDADVGLSAVDRVVMPRELTAENGAKALLMGEFSQKIPVFCPDCIDPVDKEDCLTCDGEGELYQHVNISWVNIKAIYDMAVKHLAV